MLGKAARRRLALGLLALLPGAGCGREFFREWADMDVTEAVFEKTRDPRWRMPVFTVDPPAMSRFANYADPDRPPAPPDDHATEALSPYPQKPAWRLMVPMEGTGYLDMLEQGPRYEEPPGETKPGDPATTVIPDMSDESLPPPAGSSPFNNNAIPSTPRNLPDPPLPALPGSEPSGSTLPRINPGRENNATPPGVPQRPAAPNPSAAPTALPGSSARRAPTPRPIRDPRLVAATFQVQDTPPTAPGVVTPPQDPNLPKPGSGIDITPLTDQERNQIFNRPNATPEEAQAVQAGVADFASVLSSVQIEVSQATAAGLPVNSRPYVVNPATALQLALVNSRNYQFRLETVYIQSLAVTLARFNFEPQGYAGISPSTQGAGGLPFTGNGNQFVYQTQAFGAQRSQLTLSQAAGLSKLFTYGGRLAAGFAASTVFNFIGSKPQQPVVSSSLPIAFAQPFLKGGGRAVIMEPLTQAERTLLYEVRNFARSRQQFFVSILASQQPDAQGGTGEPSIGYLNVLSLYQQAENARITVASFQRALEIYSEYAKNSSASGVSPLQVDQQDQQYRQFQIQLINAQIAYRNALDQYKQQMGIPPDVPLILDLSPIDAFRRVERDLLEWQKRPGHNPEELPGIVSHLPVLETINLDGRPLFEYVKDAKGELDLTARYSDPEKLEEFLLVGERIALENRLDLMNQRATLYDLWRQLEVQANGLLPVFNVSLQYQLLTPSTTTNPFGFNSASNQTSLTFNGELPLIRVNERNGFRQALINYERGRRALMFQEDAIKNQIRIGIRNLIASSETYELAKVILVNVLRQRDQALQQIIAPPAQGNADITNVATQTLNFISSVTGILNQLNSLITGWVQFESQRLALYRDLGIMPYDEWEAYYELFPASASGNANQPGGGTPAAAGGNNLQIETPAGRGS